MQQPRSYSVTSRLYGQIKDGDGLVNTRQLYYGRAAGPLMDSDRVLRQHLETLLYITLYVLISIFRVFHLMSRKEEEQIK